MKRVVLVFITIMILLPIWAMADMKVTATGVGESTQNLKYEVVDSGLVYWKPKYSSSQEYFGFIAIKNTGRKYIYLKDCHFDFEDDNGHLIHSSDYISIASCVIAPEKIGFFFEKDNFSKGTNVSKGVNLVAQFSLEEASEKINQYKSIDKSLKYKKGTPVFTGRITNNTKSDDFYVSVYCILEDADKKVLWIDSTIVEDFYAGTTVGFTMTMNDLPPTVKKGNVKYYKMIAMPPYHQ